MRILLAIDNSRPSAEAVKAVLSRPWPRGSVIRVLSCAMSLAPAGATDAAMGAILYLDKGPLGEAERISADIAFELAFNDLDAHAVVREGDPAHEILHEAEEWAADLIVVGTHGYTGVKKLLYGSVAQKVVRLAPCSVEVVKQSRTLKTRKYGSGEEKTRAIYQESAAA